MCKWFCLGLGVWAPWLAPRLRGKGPERGPPLNAFLPSLEAECVGYGERGPPSGRKGYGACECLQTSLEEHGEVFQWERAGSAQRPHRPEAEPSMAPALGQPCPDIPGLQGYCPRKGQAAGSVSDMPGHLPGVSPTRAFPQGLGLI